MWGVGCHTVHRTIFYLPPFIRFTMGRVKQWATILTASIVSLVSLIAAFDDRKISDWEKYQKWTVSVASISVGISFLGALVSMLPAGQALKLESPLVRCVAFLCLVSQFVSS